MRTNHQGCVVAGVVAGVAAGGAAGSAGAVAGVGVGVAAAGAVPVSAGRPHAASIPINASEAKPGEKMRLNVAFISNLRPGSLRVCQANHLFIHQAARSGSGLSESPKDNQCAFIECEPRCDEFAMTTRRHLRRGRSPPTSDAHRHKQIGYPHNGNHQQRDRRTGRSRRQEPFR
jgi:hypothetical protein